VVFVDVADLLVVELDLGVLDLLRDVGTRVGFLSDVLEDGAPSAGAVEAGGGDGRLADLDAEGSGDEREHQLAAGVVVAVGFASACV